jgi:hypothetical protein
MLKVKTVTITAALKANPQIQSQVTLTPTWACDPPVWRGGGQDGHNGDPGDDANDEHGTGGPGHKGERAHDGFASTVAVGWTTGPNGERLALAAVETAGLGDAIFVLDPTTPLKVFATGGNGGPGGTGGFGGSTHVGKAGKGGRAGDGGDGGNGNTIVVRYDASDPSLANLVVTDVRGGAGGQAGYTGAGGQGLDKAEPGDEGEHGDNGHDGRDGSTRNEPVRGLSQTLAQMASESRPPAQNEPQQQPQPGQPPPPPRNNTSADGARTYVGTGVLDATMPGQRPLHQRQNVQVLSTRTSRHHFTIAFQGGSDCKLDFHRTGDPGRHRYVLDAATTCVTPEITIRVGSATLELEPKTDQLSLVWDGKGAPPHGRAPAPIALHFALKAQRR